MQGGRDTVKVPAAPDVSGLGSLNDWYGLPELGGDAEEAEALVCKTSLSGFESRRHLQDSGVFVSCTLSASKPIRVSARHGL